MNRIRNLVFYISILVGFSVMMYLIIKAGKELEPANDVLLNAAGDNQKTFDVSLFQSNLKHSLAVLLLQIVTIILAARFFAWICRLIGQPAVIGEIIAGIVLGPSLAGLYFPEFSGFLFPLQSLGNLQLLSQIGLILFMFVIGMELDLKVLRNQAHEAVVISHASIIIPFALGMGLAYILYRSFAPSGVAFISYSLFFGISLSITAFPVLARIVQERGMYKTKLGTIVITCAAVDDITAWSMLAAVIAIVKAGNLMSALPTILLGIVYVIVMIKVVKPFLRRVGELHASRESMSKSIVGIFFLVLILSSYTTEIIGIHALFGAFMAGLTMPENRKFKQVFIEKVEDVALVLLLPLFFVYTGLRTQIGLLNDPYLWGVCGFVILVAITGKFAGSALAAKVVGQSWRDSLTIGALMNTRGLVELVALNIGYDLGVLTPELFSILVLMALVTTFMTAPSLNLIERLFKRPVSVLPSEMNTVEKQRILISFARPEMGKVLLRLADELVNGQSGYTRITAIHLFSGNLFNEFKIENYEENNFNPIRSEARKLKIDINTVFRVTEDISAGITEEANKGKYDLLLVGFGQSIFQGTALGRILGYFSMNLNPYRIIDQFKGREKFFSHTPFDEMTRKILTNVRIPVGVLFNRGLQKADRILVPVFSQQDAFLIRYARKFIVNSGAQINVLDAEGIIDSKPDIRAAIDEVERFVPGLITITAEGKFTTDQLKQYDLMLTSIDSWRKLDGLKSFWYKDASSLLILKQ